ncbi:MAG: sigma-70 family RNA polymerase sigma factor [Myxococcales bacterium]|nr:sigma-70 family RNA polymerase sigma factor [Myxococcales bacterium]
MASAFDGASLRAYRNNLQGVTPLDRETERDLARRWLAGDNAAGEKIVEACLPFVIAIALEYRRWGIPLEDIVQQGNLGLLRAAKKFDPERDVRLATYAAYWIRAEIREYVVRSYRVVRLGTTKGERKALRAYRTSTVRDVDSLMQASGLSRERVEMLMPLLASREMSLDHSVGEDSSPAVDRLQSNDPSPEDEAASHEGRDRAEAAVSLALRSLSERERLIVRERLMNDEPITLQRLGEMLGVSKERVRQLEERARDKLRGHLQEFRAYAEAV